MLMFTIRAGFYLGECTLLAMIGWIPTGEMLDDADDFEMFHACMGVGCLV
jgi:hypothetical protein